MKVNPLVAIAVSLVPSLALAQEGASRGSGTQGAPARSPSPSGQQGNAPQQQQQQQKRPGGAPGSDADRGSSRNARDADDRRGDAKGGDGRNDPNRASVSDVLEGSSAEAAARANATAPDKARAIPDVPADTPAARFGGRNQFAISSDVGLSVENTSQSEIDGSTTTLRLQPGLDWFAIDNLSVGGFVGLNYISTPGGDSTSFAVGPRVGYNIAFADRFSVWPRVGVSLATSSQSQDIQNANGDGTTERSVSNTAVAFNLFVPAMIHPVEHFFAGFGPVLDADLSGDNKTTTFGGRLTVGGWL